jgi:two-component system OmpR family sensor kinase/two-component system sensor histidine kinase BaeS
VIVLMLSVCGTLALAWLVATRLGLATPSDQSAAAIVLVGGMAGVALAVLTLMSVGRRLAIPLGGVMEAADRVAAGDYEVRVTEQGPPPLRALTRAFNTMTERLQNHDRLRRDLMADLAHELRTPLTVIQGKLEGLLDGVYPRDEQHLQALLEETHVLSRLVDDLRTLALSESGALKLQKESINVASLAREAAAAFAGDAAARGVTLDVDAPAVLPPIEIDPVRIREVMTNLLSNALRHTPAGGSVHVRVSESQIPNPESRITIEVHDTGSGMTPEELAHAFDRFYKGAESRGSGLGLTIARNLIAAHGGEIHASSEPQRGTTIAFTLPRETWQT